MFTTVTAADLDALHDRLARWEQHECTDPEPTLSAFRVMGILSAASALLDQGVALPDRWVADQIAWAHELMGDNPEEDTAT